MRTTVKVAMQKNAESGRKMLEVYVLCITKVTDLCMKLLLMSGFMGKHFLFLSALLPTWLGERLLKQAQRFFSFFFFSPSLKPSFICYVWSYCYPSTLCRDGAALYVETVLHHCHLTTSMSPAVDQSQGCAQLLQSSYYGENLSSPTFSSAIFGLLFLHDMKNAGAAVSANVPCGIAISYGGKICSAQ